jgi:hypothetical protein
LANAFSKKGDNVSASCASHARPIFLLHPGWRIQQSQLPMIHDAAFEKASHELENVGISDTPRYLCD